MKHSSAFMQALCLATLMIMACGGRLPVKNRCNLNIILKDTTNLINKTNDFIQSFPQDKNKSVRLLTEALENDFKENCSTRNQLLSFYAEDVLSAGKILAEAKKSGIDHDFLKIQDLLQFCTPGKCEATEVTRNMKELREKFDGNKVAKGMKRLNKAVSEFRSLLFWIHNFAIHELKKTKGRK
ncbi:interleukin-26 [Aquarana catesbeiana]|uniref:interleukin-26 n=1 Tax=Aquarana catesbeiana TaxID=8400 RepID=UPI003CC98A90